MSCGKAQGFLAKTATNVRRTVDARRERLGSREALALARTVSRIVVSRGGRVVEFDMKRQPDDAELLKALLGPSGNLRAPTLRVGRTLYVGFSERAYAAALKPDESRNA